MWYRSPKTPAESPSPPLPPPGPTDARMNLLTLARRGLSHYWRTHLGALVGTALATMVLAGALLIGGVMRASLERLALLRLGGVHLALFTGERQVREASAAALGAELAAPAAAALHLRGSLALPDGDGRLVGGVAVYGVDDAFWPLAAPGRGSPFLTGGQDQIALSPVLAARLAVRPGQSVLLRCERPSPLSRDALLSTSDNATLTLRLTVAAILPEEGGGRFGLEATQEAPLAAFVPLAMLQERLDLRDRANLLLIGEPANPLLQASPGAFVRAAHKTWRQVAQLADLGLTWREVLLARTYELRSHTVFIGDDLVERVMEVSPTALGVYTYFVNELRVGERRTPYSMVAAIGRLAGI